ncbi:hypothetical protein BC827DRAFT_1285905 [Russula dissimulans]|nr:hypothetical protein BC827DRAFT_1285905 [Russula dissimulans]
MASLTPQQVHVTLGAPGSIIIPHITTLVSQSRLLPAAKLKRVPLPRTHGYLQLRPLARDRRGHCQSQETGKVWRHSQHRSMACTCTRNAKRYEPLTHKTGSWTIDPMAPLVPEQNLVQMFLYGQSEKKRWGRSRNPKAAPPTAKFGTRHGNIQATLRVVGDSMVRSIATIRAESRKGNIVLDLTRDLHEARTSLIKAETSKTRLEQQVEELSRRLQRDAERLAVYERRSSAANGTTHHIGVEGASPERRLEADLRASLKVAEVDLAAARNHIQQFKEISQAGEEALASLNATHDEYKSTEAQLSASWVWSSHSYCLQAQQEELQSTLKNVEQELEQARTSLADTKHVFERAREEWQADKKTLENTIVDMAAAEKNLAEDRSSRESDARAHEELVKAAEERYSREAISHAEAIRVVEDLKRQLHDLQVYQRRLHKPNWPRLKVAGVSKRQALDREIADLATRCKALTEQNNVLHKHLDNVSSQAAHIRQTADLTVDTPGEGENTDGTDSELSQLRAVINYLRKEKEIVDIQLELGKQENGRLKTQIGYLTRDLEDTRATLSDERECAASSAGTDAQHAELVEKIQQLNLLRESNATLRADSEAHAKRWRKLDVRLKALIQELDPLHEGARTMQAELDARKEHVGRLEEENRRWRERNN